MANWTGNAYVNSLLLGSKWSSPNLTYFLDNSAGTWTAIEKSAFQNAVQSWQNVSNITFTEVFSAASANLVEKFFNPGNPGFLGQHGIILDYSSPTITTHGGSLTGQIE